MDPKKDLEIYKDFLEKIERVSMVLLNHKKIIIDYNKNFMELVNGDLDKSLFVNLRINKTDINPPIIKSFKLATISLSYKVFLYPLEEDYLLFLKPEKIKENKLIESMSVLTNQLTDITRELTKKNRALKLANEKITTLMHTDPLTELLNRRRFNEILDSELSKAARHDISLSLVMIDIDFFKKINDKYGHQSGDYVLKTLASILKKESRYEDSICRFGGEEFIVLLPLTNISSAEYYGENIRLVVEKTWLQEIKAYITISIGVTEYRKGDSRDDIVKRADIALYRAKEKGRNRVESTL